MEQLPGSICDLCDFRTCPNPENDKNLPLWSEKSNHEFAQLNFANFTP